MALIGGVVLLAVLAVVLAVMAAPDDPRSATTSDAVKRDCPVGGGDRPTVVQGRAEVGEPLPEVTMRTVDGCTVSLADYRGTPLVVAFGASWCQPCHVEWPHLVDELEARRGNLQVVAVAFREALTADTRDFLDEIGAPFQALDDRDGTVAQAFGVRTVPTTFYVDAEGVVRDRLFVGDRASVAGAIDALGAARTR